MLKQKRPEKLTLTGQMAVSDKYGRLRLILLEESNITKELEGSYFKLKAAIPPSSGGSLPYTSSGDNAPDEDGVWGIVTLTPPKGRKKEYLRLAEQWQSKEVVVLVTPRRYSFVSKAHYNYGSQVTGTVLDLMYLTLRTKTDKS